MRQLPSFLTARLGGVAAAAALLLSSGLAQAVPLAPGGTVSIGGTTVALDPGLAGTVLEDRVRTFTNAGGLFNSPYDFSVQDRVVRNTAGTLDFYYRISVGADSTNVFYASRSSFAGFLTDVDWRSDGLGAVAPTSVSRPLDIDGVTGSSLIFTWGPSVSDGVHAGESSRFFYVHTDATAYDEAGAGRLGYLNSRAITSTGFFGLVSFATFQPVAAPVPEPGTGLILLAGLGLIGGVVRRSRNH